MSFELTPEQREDLKKIYADAPKAREQIDVTLAKGKGYERIDSKDPRHEKLTKLFAEDDWDDPTVTELIMVPRNDSGIFHCEVMDKAVEYVVVLADRDAENPEIVHRSKSSPWQPQ